MADEPRRSAALPGMPAAAGVDTPKPRPRKPRASKSDAMLAVLGIALGLGCAYFPWYVFFNPDQFGPPAVQFSGEGVGDPDLSGPFFTPSVPFKPGPVDTAGIPALLLDSLPTGTLPPRDAEPAEAIDAGEQPFPATPANFSLVHIANGRAMIQDSNGLFVVETGSVLPDNSKVLSIERRSGKWIMVTSGNRVIEVAP